MRSCLLCCCLVMACGSPQEKTSLKSDSPAQEPNDKAATPVDAPDARVVAAPKPGLQLEPSPIEIPNARLYDGYVLGGLPSTEQLDAALEAGFDSAMSLMSSDEADGPALARYGASKGLRYLRFTIAGEEDLNESMAWQFASTQAMLGRPAFVHCSTGERVAAIFALKAYFVDELPAQEAFAIGEALGMGEFTEHVRQLLELSPS